MAIQVAAGFDYKGPNQNFERDHFDTVAEMAAYATSNLPDEFECLCAGKKYIYNSSNTVDETLGKWRLQTSDDITVGEEKEILTDVLDDINDAIDDKSSVSVSTTSATGASTAKSITVDGTAYNLPGEGSSRDDVPFICTDAYTGYRTDVENWFLEDWRKGVYTVDDTARELSDFGNGIKVPHEMYSKVYQLVRYISSRPNNVYYISYEFLPLGYIVCMDFDVSGSEPYVNASCVYRYDVDEESWVYTKDSIPNTNYYRMSIYGLRFRTSTSTTTTGNFPIYTRIDQSRSTNRFRYCVKINFKEAIANELKQPSLNIDYKRAQLDWNSALYLVANHTNSHDKSTGSVWFDFSSSHLNPKLRLGIANTHLGKTIDDSGPSDYSTFVVMPGVELYPMSSNTSLQSEYLGWEQMVDNLFSDVYYFCNELPDRINGSLIDENFECIIQYSYLDDEAQYYTDILDEDENEVLKPIMLPGNWDGATFDDTNISILWINNTLLNRCEEWTSSDRVRGYDENLRTYLNITNSDAPSWWDGYCAAYEEVTGFDTNYYCALTSSNYDTSHFTEKSDWSYVYLSKRLKQSNLIWYMKFSTTDDDADETSYIIYDNFAQNLNQQAAASTKLAPPSCETLTYQNYTFENRRNFDVWVQFLQGDFDYYYESTRLFHDVAYVKIPALTEVTVTVTGGTGSTLKFAGITDYGDVCNNYEWQMQKLASSGDITSTAKMVTAKLTNNKPELSVATAPTVSASATAVTGATTAKSLNVNGTNWNLPEGGSGGLDAEVSDEVNASEYTSDIVFNPHRGDTFVKRTKSIECDKYTYGNITYYLPTNGITNNALRSIGTYVSIYLDTLNGITYIARATASSKGTPNYICDVLGPISSLYKTTRDIPSYISDNWSTLAVGPINPYSATSAGTEDVSMDFYEEVNTTKRFRHKIELRFDTSVDIPSIFFMYPPCCLDWNSGLYFEALRTTYDEQSTDHDSQTGSFFFDFSSSYLNPKIRLGITNTIHGNTQIWPEDQQTVAFNVVPGLELLSPNWSTVAAMARHIYFYCNYLPESINGHTVTEDTEILTISNNNLDEDCMFGNDVLSEKYPAMSHNDFDCCSFWDTPIWTLWINNTLCKRWEAETTSPWLTYDLNLSEVMDLDEGDAPSWWDDWVDAQQQHEASWVDEDFYNELTVSNYLSKNASTKITWNYFYLHKFLKTTCLNYFYNFESSSPQNFLIYDNFSTNATTDTSYNANTGCETLTYQNYMFKNETSTHRFVQFLQGRWEERSEEEPTKSWSDIAWVDVPPQSTVTVTVTGGTGDCLKFAGISGYGDVCDSLQWQLYSGLYSSLTTTAQSLAVSKTSNGKIEFSLV